jgi:uncharacterized membrane protein YdcZ (DUF606 family)
MGRMLIGCLAINLVGLVACGALLLYCPKDSGFTITTSKSTYYFAGGELLGAALLCLLDLTIGVYLAWSFWSFLHRR